MSNICKNIAAAVQGAVNFYELVSMDSTVTSNENSSYKCKAAIHCSLGNGLSLQQGTVTVKLAQRVQAESESPQNISPLPAEHQLH